MGETMTEQSAGGTQWELETAWQMVEAARAADDLAAENVAMRRYSEGLRNLVTGALADQLIPMLIEIRGFRADRGDDAKIIAHKLDLLMTLAEGGQALLGKFEARLNMIEANTLASIITQTDREQLIAFARTIPNLTTRVEALEAARDGGAEAGGDVG